MKSNFNFRSYGVDVPDIGKILTDFSTRMSAKREAEAERKRQEAIDAENQRRWDLTNERADKEYQLRVDETNRIKNDKAAIKEYYKQYGQSAYADKPNLTDKERREVYGIKIPGLDNPTGEKVEPWNKSNFIKPEGFDNVPQWSSDTEIDEAINNLPQILLSPSQRSDLAIANLGKQGVDIPVELLKTNIDLHALDSKTEEDNKTELTKTQTDLQGKIESYSEKLVKAQQKEGNRGYSQKDYENATYDAITTVNNAISKAAKDKNADVQANFSDDRIGTITSRFVQYLKRDPLISSSPGAMKMAASMFANSIMNDAPSFFGVFGGDELDPGRTDTAFANTLQAVKAQIASNPDVAQSSFGIGLPEYYNTMIDITKGQLKEVDNKLGQYNVPIEQRQQNKYRQQLLDKFQPKTDTLLGVSSTATGNEIPSKGNKPTTETSANVGTEPNKKVISEAEQTYITKAETTKNNFNNSRVGIKQSFAKAIELAPTQEAKDNLTKRLEVQLNNLDIQEKSELTKLAEERRKEEENVKSTQFQEYIKPITDLANKEATNALKNHKTDWVGKAFGWAAGQSEDFTKLLSSEVADGSKVLRNLSKDAGYGNKLTSDFLLRVINDKNSNNDLKLLAKNVLHEKYMTNTDKNSIDYKEAQAYKQKVKDDQMTNALWAGVAGLSSAAGPMLSGAKAAANPLIKASAPVFENLTKKAQGVIKLAEPVLSKAINKHIPPALLDAVKVIPSRNLPQLKVADAAKGIQIDDLLKWKTQLEKHIKKISPNTKNTQLEGYRKDMVALNKAIDKTLKSHKGAVNNYTGKHAAKANAKEEYGKLAEEMRKLNPNYGTSMLKGNAATQATEIPVKNDDLRNYLTGTKAEATPWWEK